MNPSSSGWIKKHLLYFVPLIREQNYDTYYDKFREIGFIYGTSIDTIISETPQQLQWTETEKTKINLLDSLVTSYYQRIENATESECVATITKFYDILDTKKPFFEIPTSVKNGYEKLEKIIHLRVQTNESQIKKNFSHILTNALLFIDVLTFEYYLSHNNDPASYAAKLEETLTSTVFLALQSKENKDKYDELLVKLFASSVRYTIISKQDDVSAKQLSLQDYTYILEKRYIIDLTCLAVWNDKMLDIREHNFVSTLGKELQLEDHIVRDSISHVHQFIEAHKTKISFFRYSNPVNHFYQQTTRTVSVLILRNKKRLLKELLQSKELVILLHQSTHRDLTEEEKHLVKEQLLDICKTIPSLAIFILPGGSILMPILIKFIPQLLPSAFNENKI